MADIHNPNEMNEALSAEIASLADELLEAVNGITSEDARNRYYSNPEQIVRSIADGELLDKGGRSFQLRVIDKVQGYQTDRHSIDIALQEEIGKRMGYQEAGIEAQRRLEELASYLEDYIGRAGYTIDSGVLRKILKRRK